MTDAAKTLVDSVFEDKAKERRLRRRLQKHTFVLVKSRKELPHGKYVVLDAITRRPFTPEMADGMTLDYVERWFAMLQEFGR